MRSIFSFKQPPAEPNGDELTIPSQCAVRRLGQGYEFVGCIFAYNGIAHLISSGKQTEISSMMSIGNRVALSSGGNKYAARDVIFYQNDIALDGTNYCRYFTEMTFLDNRVATYVDRALASDCTNFCGCASDMAFNFLQNEVHIQQEAQTSLLNTTCMFRSTTDLLSIQSKILDIFEDVDYGLVSIEPVHPVPYLHGVFSGLPWTQPTSFLGIPLDAVGPDGSGFFPTGTAVPTSTQSQSSLFDTIAPTRSIPPNAIRLPMLYQVFLSLVSIPAARRLIPMAGPTFVLPAAQSYRSVQALLQLKYQQRT